MTRQAIMSVARGLLLPLLPAGKSTLDLDGVADATGERFTWLAEVLLFPAGTKITGVSTALRFDRDEICLRLESPDFVETAQGNQLPGVDASYHWHGGGMNFMGWSGPAVAVSSSEPAVKFREFL